MQNPNGNPIIIASTISDHNESLNLYFTFLDINNPLTYHIALSSIKVIITSKIYIIFNIL